jgi:glycosyltransferase involved in cell wall biosynthesis
MPNHSNYIQMKIYFCTTAPSKSYKSWSNIPYLLHKNLEKKGCSVKNYVMREVEPLKTAFNLPVRVLNKFFNLGTTYFYVRTPVHFFFTRLYGCYIGLVSAKQDVMLVQGFSFPLHNGKNKQIIFGDWPSEYLFEKFLKRQPGRWEQNSIDRENAVIEAADAVVTLFPDVRDYMLQKYQNKNIYCFGNVVNVDDEVVVPKDIQHRKINSKRLLFVGRPFYLSGAIELINAVRNIRQAGLDCEVDIVGIEPSLVGAEYEWLKVHGYLDKEKPEEKEKYFELMSNARLFVNTTPGWSSFQAILEAMYFHNPIVVRPNESLSSYFPNLNDFSYILAGGEENLTELLLEGFSDEKKYRLLSEISSQSVQSSTWGNFTEKMLTLLES